LRAYEMGSDWALPGEDITFDSVDNFDSWDRCVTRGMPSMMMPYRYNGGFRIWQTPGYVVFQTEMIHEARIIPTDGRPALDDGVRQWLGDSRGYWEGTTLVVETTNYRDGMAINNPMINLAVQGSPPGNRFPASDQMKTTERIVRLNDDTWLYEITTEDPVILTEPFTVRYPMRHDPDYVMPEYACHEGNTIVRHYIETDRCAGRALGRPAADRDDRPRHRARVHEERRRHDQRPAGRHHPRRDRQAASRASHRRASPRFHVPERRPVERVGHAHRGRHPRRGHLQHSGHDARHVPTDTQGRELTRDGVGKDGAWLPL